MRIVKIVLIYAFSFFGVVANAAHPFYDETSLDKPTTLSKTSPIKLGVLDKEKCYLGNLKEQLECDPKMREEVLLTNERIYYSRQVKPVCVMLFSAAGCPPSGKSIYSIFEKSTGDYLGYEETNNQRGEKIRSEFFNRIKNTNIPPEMEGVVNQVKIYGSKIDFLLKILEDINNKNEEFISTELPEKSISLYTASEKYNLKLSVLNVKINLIKIDDSKFVDASKTTGMQSVDETLSVQVYSDKKIPFKVVNIRCTKKFEGKVVANMSIQKIDLEKGFNEVKIKGKYNDDAQYPFRDKADTTCRADY